MPVSQFDLERESLRCFSAKEAAQLLRIKPHLLYQMHKDGKLSGAFLSGEKRGLRIPRYTIQALFE